MISKEIVLYAMFAGVATALNVVFQRLVFLFHKGPGTIFPAMIGGACVALVVKYFLDRTFVFSVQSRPEAGEFLRYAFTGALITLGYFVVEYLVWTTYRTGLARDIGIVLGMITGYAIKYALDRKFVFKKRQASRHADPKSL